MLRENTILDGVYQVIREIGRGGAGIVYLAFHLRLQKYVVLKNARLNRSDMAYLRNEADMLKGLHHASLPQVYDFLQIGDEIYTVIDYINGIDFEKLVTEGYSFSEEQLTNYMLELAEVLVYLHGQEPPVIHSDIKPGNVMLRQDGSICLIDFNISIWCGGSSALYGFSQYYTAPEQVQLAMEIANRAPVSVQLDGRSDIYSLGATMYYVMTGIRPGENGARCPLSALKTGYSRGLVKIIEMCMADNPDERFQTAEQLCQVLKKHLRRGSSFRRRCIMQAAILCGCGLIVCAGILSLVYGLKEQRHNLFLNEVQVVRLAADEGNTKQVISQGIRLLNEYEDQSSRSPNSWYQMLRAVGDSYAALAEETEQGKDSALEHAAQCYEEAAAFAAENQLDDALECVIRWASVLMRCGDTNKLQETAKFEAYMNPIQNQLLEGLRQAYLGEETQLLQMARQSATDSETRMGVYSACLALAAVRGNDGDVLGQITYFTEANLIKPSDEIVEQLAEAYMRAGEQTQDSSYFSQASTMYQSIAETEHAGLRVKLGYATALRANGSLEQACAVIDGLCKAYPDNFDVMAQASLIYSQSGQNKAAAEFAKSAMQLAPEKNQSEIWAILHQIAGG